MASSSEILAIRHYGLQWSTTDYVIELKDNKQHYN
jgi:hypothetical protein